MRFQKFTLKKFLDKISLETKAVYIIQKTQNDPDKKTTKDHLTTEAAIGVVIKKGVLKDLRESTVSEPLSAKLTAKLTEHVRATASATTFTLNLSKMNLWTLIGIYY